MRKLRSVCIVLLLIATPLGLSKTMNAAQKPADLGTDIRPLEQGRPIEREMTGTEVHSYQITLVRGQFVRAIFDQRGIDVVVNVFGPDGQRIAEVDSPTGSQGPEIIELEAKASGTYFLVVRAFDKAAGPGHYEAKVAALLTAEQYAAFLTAERVKLQAAKNWLASTAIPLRTVEAGHGFADLQPLKKLIGGAHLVSLGEATHGTREFFQLKHRMLEFLVSEMGFTVFGIEATMPEAFDINQYVLTGEGDPVKALAGLYFWTWDTEEVLEMIRWMRRYNADPHHARKVKFYGFDMQFAPRAAKLMLEYLRRVDPEQAEAAERALGMLANPYTVQDFSLLPREKKEEKAAFIRAVLARFDAHKRDYVKRTSSAEWVLARQHARIVAQNVESQMDQGFAVRDRSMAENIRWVLEREGPGAKIVIWAHNGHVATQSGLMGAHLREMFGVEMVVFGFAFNEGSFQARETAPEGELRTFHVRAAREGSIDAVLADAGLRIAAIDLRAIPKNGPVADWFAAPRDTRDIGALYSEQSVDAYFSKQVVTRLYDGLFFIKSTAAARALEAGRRPALQRLAAPANLDFESGEPGKPPIDWVVPPGLSNFAFHVALSDENPRSGKRCAVIARAPGGRYGEIYGSLQQRIDASVYRGKRIKLRAAARAEVNGTGNQAHLWLRIMKKGFAPRAIAFYDGMANRPIIIAEWRDYEIVGDVPLDAETIDYGLALVGDGRAWIDSVSLEVVDK